jgi:hypothetical protein
MHAFRPVRQMDGRVVSTLMHVAWCLLHCMRRDSGARSHAARNARCVGCVGCSRISHGSRGTLRVACRARWGRRAGAFAERAARCTRAQLGGYGGGVIRMDKGAALFDGVAISNAVAEVRAGGRRWVSGPMGVGGAGAV